MLYKSMTAINFFRWTPRQASAIHCNQFALALQQVTWTYHLLASHVAGWQISWPRCSQP